MSTLTFFFFNRILLVRENMLNLFQSWKAFSLSSLSMMLAVGFLKHILFCAEKSKHSRPEAVCCLQEACLQDWPLVKVWEIGFSNILKIKYSTLIYSFSNALHFFMLIQVLTLIIMFLPKEFSFNIFFYASSAGSNFFFVFFL